MRSIFLSLLCLFLVETCQKPEKEQPLTAPQLSQETLRSCADKAPFIVVAKLVEIRPPLGFGSGQFLVVQWVHYKVEEVIKGQVEEKSISVGYYIVARRTNSGETIAQLSPQLFKTDTRFVLFLENDPKKGYIDRGDPSDRLPVSYLSLESCSLLPANEENIGMVKKAL